MATFYTARYAREVLGGDRVTTDKVKEIVDDVFGVYYSEYMGQGEYNEDEAQEALDTALNALDEVEKYKKAIEEIKAEILSLKGDNFPNCYYVKIIDKHIKGVKS